jgi:hypothetical protein
MKKRWWILIGIVVLGLIAIFFTFVYTKNCKDAACFNRAMIGCDKAKYTEETAEASWLYTIKNKEGGLLCSISIKYCDSCKINVKLLQLKQGKVEVQSIEGLDMNCEVPIKYSGSPQADISKCHGLLKEKMQELIIQKMYSEIVANIGKVGEDLNKAF